jgi:hypothetical protein
MEASSQRRSKLSSREFMAAITQALQGSTLRSQTGQSDDSQSEPQSRQPRFLKFIFAALREITSGHK